MNVSDGDLSETEVRVLTELEREPMTCSQLGSTLWGRAARKPQSYARSAGKLLRRLEHLGYVETQLRMTSRTDTWTLTRWAKGSEALWRRRIS